MDLSKLALLANELGGIDEVAELLNVDENDLQFALEGGKLEPRRSRVITRAYLDFEDDEDLQKKYNIDLDKINKVQTEALDQAIEYMPEKQYQDIFRFAFAEGRISQDYLETDKTAKVRGYDLFAYLGLHQVDAVMNWVNEGNSLDDVLAKWINDIEIGGGMMPKDSLFWDWFKELVNSP
jgi:hypothetical protein